MSFVFLVVLLMVKQAVCFWYDDCDVIPAAGCTCYNDSPPRVDCSNLQLELIPQYRNNDSTVEKIDLDLSGNYLGVISKDAFSWNILIRELVLSNNNVSGVDDVFSLDSDSMSEKQRVALRHLILVNDGLESIPSIVVDSNIVLLDLSDNNINTIHQDDFRGMSKLVQLELKGNPLTLIEINSFSHIQNIEVLSISFDTNLPEDVINTIWTSSLESIESLSIQGCTFISLDVLRYYNKLEFVDISNCPIVYDTLLTSVLHKSKETLRYLRLSGNDIFKLGFPLNSHIEHLDLSGNDIRGAGAVFFYIPYRSTFASLRILGLADNSIFMLNADDLEFYPNLEELDLSYNHIMLFGKNILRYVPKLKILDLSHNSLVWLDRSFLPPQGYPINLRIKLEHNSLHCICHMEWLGKVLHEQHMLGIGPYSWYDVYNLKCIEDGQAISVLNAYIEGKMCA